MKTIWKYELKPSTFQEIEMPKGATIRSVQEQHGELCFWAEVESDRTSDTETRRFEVFGTGHPIPQTMGVERSYLATVLMHGGQLVWHIYEYTGV